MALVSLSLWALCLVTEVLALTQVLAVVLARREWQVQAEAGLGMGAER